MHIPQAERYSSKDWFHNLSTMPSSRLLKRIRGVVIFNFFWSLLVYIVHSRTGFKSPGSRCHSLLGELMNNKKVRCFQFQSISCRPALLLCMSRELATIGFGVWNQRAGGILIATGYSAVILLKRRTHHLHTYVLLSSFFSTGSALGLLLVFRTNTAYNRFWEGRRIWERILNSLRDLGRMTVLYGDVIKSARVEKILHLLCAYPLG